MAEVRIILQKKNLRKVGFCAVPFAFTITVAVNQHRTRIAGGKEVFIRRRNSTFDTILEGDSGPSLRPRLRTGTTGTTPELSLNLTDEVIDPYAASRTSQHLSSKERF
jgi:hypothetical protein